MAETSFSLNFNAGTLTDAVIKTLQENTQNRPGYGPPLAACLPGSDEPVAASERARKRTSAQPGRESDKLRRDRSDKVTFVFDYC